MPEENDKQIQLRKTGGRLGRRSDLARRGMNAFNYVSRLSTRQKPDLPQSTRIGVSFEFLRKWGTEGSGDGQFNIPTALALDEAGNVYVSEGLNHRVQVFDSEGRFLLKWGTEGSGDGQFDVPCGLALDGAGKVYVTDLKNNRVQIFDHHGRFLGKLGTEGRLVMGESDTGSAEDHIWYWADLQDNRVPVFYRSQTLSTVWTEGSLDGRFMCPQELSLDNEGNVYVVDLSNERIQVFDSQGRFLHKWRIEDEG